MIRNSYGNKQFFFSHDRTSDPSVTQFQIHRHNQYEMLLVVEGEGKFVIEDKLYDFKANTLFLVPPNTFHAIVQPPKALYERFVVNFAPSLIPSCIEKPTTLLIKPSEELIDYFKRFDFACENYPSEWLQSLFVSFVTETLLFIEFKENHASLSITLPPLIKATVNYISQNLYSPLTSQSIANALYVNRSHLSRVFSSVMKTSLMKFVKSKKMCAAYELLLIGNTPQQACDMLSFDNYSTFYRDFKREFGVAPSLITH